MTRRQLLTWVPGAILTLYAVCFTLAQFCSTNLLLTFEA